MRDPHSSDPTSDQRRAQQIAAVMVERIHGDGTRREEQSHATYLVGLWLDNDQPLYHWVCGVVADAITTATAALVAGDDEHVWPLTAAADQIKDALGDPEEGAPCSRCSWRESQATGLYADLLTWALGCVDWHRLAQSYAPDTEDLRAIVVAEVLEMLAEDYEDYDRDRYPATSADYSQADDPRDL